MGEKASVVVEDGSMHCGDHPYRSNPGGICAFCLQEKLGRLVNSSKSSSTTLFFPIPQSSSSSRISPPSLGSSAAVNVSTTANSTSTVDVYSPDHEVKSHRPSFPFFFHGLHPKGRRRKKKKNTSSVGSTPAIISGRENTNTDTINTTTTANSGFVLKRSSSVSTTTASAKAVAESPRKRWFWSFRHSSSDPKDNNNSKRQLPQTKDQHQQQHRQQWNKVSEATKPSTDTREEESKRQVVEETEESPSGSNQTSSSLGRKVVRSRSVGCGSRSFSSDLLDRMSNGLGDCALRRVESQRDPKPKTAPEVEEDDDSNTSELKRQQRVRCGGIFGGFGVVSSSSCSSSSFWLPLELGVCGGSNTPHRRPRNWGWVFASPSRPFRSSSNKPSPTVSGKPSSTNDTAASIPIPTTSLAYKSVMTG